MRYLLLTVGIAGLVYGPHLLATYAQGRGWIYYRNAPKRGNAQSGLGFEQMFEPSLEYLIEERQSQEIIDDQEDSGDQSRGTGYGVRGTNGYL